MSVISDVTRAVKTRWDSAQLVSVIPGGLHLDQLPRADQMALPLPYAVMSARQDRPNLKAMRSYTSYTRVTFEIYDVGELGDGVTAIHTAFDWLNSQGVSNRLDFSFDNTNSHVYTDKGYEDEGVTTFERDGRKFRRATVNFVLWVQRLGA